ncbi:DNA-processing protein DprA [Thioalkalicoccus limnaeus]|uniref:DNA-processing protein DprA n=1 Tax=Thioalkalicoccus limnaeus TaxID=120681 RepID=A0ABV4BAG3_9GAMM
MTPGLGRRALDALLARYGTASELVAAGADDLARAGLAREIGAAIERPDLARISASIEWAEQAGGHLLTRDDPRYPPQLAELSDAPLVLYCRGDPTLLSDPQVAIVGSRTPTPQGLEITRQLACELAGRGLVVTSGLARGIDGAAHEGALEAGPTIAVLGTGPDRVYPATHRRLAHRIAEKGALVTEYPPGTGPQAHHFPRRNRLISGLSLGVLVTEAAERSGSLITARLAGEQGREVFAMPGSIRNPRARGCHRLIRQGATLVECAEDVLVEIAPQLSGLMTQVRVAPSRGADGAASAPTLAPLDEQHQGLLSAMGYDPVVPDELIARTGLPSARIASMLLLLELEGHVSSCPGGRYCRTSGRDSESC